MKGKTEWNARTIEARAERLSGEVLRLFTVEQPTTKLISPTRATSCTLFLTRTMQLIRL